MYVEDFDLCHKIRRAGKEVYYVPAVVIKHHGGGTTGGGDNTFSSVMTSESLVRFFTKTRGSGYALLYRSAALVGALLRLSVLLVVALPARVEAAESGWRRSFRKWVAILRWTIGQEASIRKHNGLSPVDPRACVESASSWRRATWRPARTRLGHRLRLQRRSLPAAVGEQRARADASRTRHHHRRRRQHRRLHELAQRTVGPAHPHLHASQPRQAGGPQPCPGSCAQHVLRHPRDLMTSAIAAG